MFADDDRSRADWPLLQNGAINLFHSRAILAEAQAELELLGYEVTEIFCAKGRFQSQITSALNSGFDGNLNQLVDGFRYYPFGPSGRSALVFHDYHKIVADSPKLAWSVLDILEQTARDHLLESKALIGLVQTDDARYTCEGLGARTAHWNPRELTHLDRGISD
jgi:hypothetical protein